MDKDALPVVLDALRPSDFDATAHRRILEAILALRDRGQPPDLVLLNDELKARGHLDKVGGPVYLTELQDATPSAANVAHYAGIVREKAIARGMVEAARRVIDQAHTLDGNGIDALLAYAQKEILAASSTGAGPGGASIRDLMKQTFRGIEDSVQKGGTLPGLPTGFHGLDALTGGLRPGCLYILAGRPGGGKTALAANIARAVAGDGKRTVFFSLEMPGPELSLRLLSAEADIDGHRLSRGYLGTEQLSRVAAASDALAKMPLTIDDAGGLTIDRLMARARRMKAEHGLALVAVDYLQLVCSSKRWGTREQEVAEVSRSLKALAKELSAPVLACAQLNRAIEARQDKRPTLADLRESGAIEQDADVICFLSGAAGDETTELTVAKNRQGPTGNLSLLFDRPRTKFMEV